MRRIRASYFKSGTFFLAVADFKWNCFCARHCPDIFSHAAQSAKSDSLLQPTQTIYGLSLQQFLHLTSIMGSYIAIFLGNHLWKLLNVISGHCLVPKSDSLLKPTHVINGLSLRLFLLLASYRKLQVVLNNVME